jgi:hypothetical protein
MITKNKEKSLNAIFFDAVGTLVRLTKSVGYHYAYVGREVGLDLDPQTLERAFHAPGEMPQRAAIDGPRENDDKAGGVNSSISFSTAAPSLSEFDQDNFFEIAYEHFAGAVVWEFLIEVVGVLKTCGHASWHHHSWALAVYRAPRHLEIFPAFSSQRSARQTTSEIYRTPYLMNLKPNGPCISVTIRTRRKAAAGCLC